MRMNTWGECATCAAEGASDYVMNLSGKKTHVGRISEQYRFMADLWTTVPTFRNVQLDEQRLSFNKGGLFVF